MSSENKRNKAKNSYIQNGGMKSKKRSPLTGIKKLSYYTQSDRQWLKRLIKKEEKDYEQ